MEKWDHASNREHNFKEQIMKQNEENSNQCAEWDYSASKKYKLRRHVMTHTGKTIPAF